MNPNDIDQAKAWELIKEQEGKIFQLRQELSQSSERATRDTQLMRKLYDALETVRGLVDEDECRGDEDCDHCFSIHHTIDPILREARDAFCAPRQVEQKTQLIDHVHAPSCEQGLCEQERCPRCGEQVAVSLTHLCERAAQVSPEAQKFLDNGPDYMRSPDVTVGDKKERLVFQDAYGSHPVEAMTVEQWVRGALTYDPLIDSYKLKDWFARCPLRTTQERKERPKHCETPGCSREWAHYGPHDEQSSNEGESK